MHLHSASFSTTSQSDFSLYPYPRVPDMARRPAAKNRTMPERSVLPARREIESFSAAQEPEINPKLPCNQSYPMSDIEPKLSRLAMRALVAPYVP
jgi:hypothetical protein